MSFNIVWNQYRNELFNFLKSKIENKSFAEDLLQEVAIKFYKELSRGVLIENKRAWLYKVANNLIIDYYRKRVKQENISFIYKQELDIEEEPCVCELSGFVIQNYLPKEYAEPLFLSDIEKVPQKIIAKQLNLSLPATKSRIKRARVKLKELIESCVDLLFNNQGQVVDFTLKNSCELPTELKLEMQKMKINL
ncbi:RNA polymerase, sigma subunit, SigZ [Tenacibaculum sp. MAR_2009_124]|uniref:sigma factor n=1 Tax=Tenacibaculum sp. MAR_2009_124 TaxID=1250059 RepID=UPI00089C05C5|nr:sigma factor [Tenacibaculum sp. MAR_2009_124]SEB39664.1 RNA polymerase, sigma subunit, SigZ [Tenacibaculum sp. MAR_2009_124]